jgi:hypothetical protein
METKISKKIINQNEFAWVSLVVDKPFYYSGDQILATIYIEILKPCKYNESILVFKGMEKAELHTIINQPSQAPTSTKYVEKNTLINTTNTFYSWSQPMKGQYTIPFKFALPNDMFGSIEISNIKNESDGINKASIKYNMTFLLHSADNSLKDIGCKVPIIIRPRMFMSSLLSQLGDKQCTAVQCYCNKGCTVVQASFTNAPFCLGQDVKMNILIRNDQCSIPVEAVVGEVYQNIRCRTQKNNIVFKTVVAKKTFAIHVDAYQSMKENMLIVFKLADYSRNHYQPSIAAKIIECTYEVKLKLLYSGSKFLSLNDLDYELNLYSPEFEMSPPIKRQDWNSVTYTMGTVIVNQNTLYVSDIAAPETDQMEHIRADSIVSAPNGIDITNISGILGMKEEEKKDQ